jgi:hypothetical protein
VAKGRFESHVVTLAYPGNFVMTKIFKLQKAVEPPVQIFKMFFAKKSRKKATSTGVNQF